MGKRGWSSRYKMEKYSLKKLPHFPTFCREVQRDASGERKKFKNTLIAGIMKLDQTKEDI